MSGLDISTIAALGPLIGTLTPEGVKSAMQAQEDAENQRLQQRADEATQASQEAEQQYQQAAAQPAPAANPFVQGLLGNLGAIIARNPALAEQAQGNIRMEQARLNQQRADNLQSLRDIYERKAIAAEHSGDIIAAEKARVAHERLSQQLQDMRDQAALARTSTAADLTAKREADNAARERQTRLDVVAATGAENRKTEAMKQGAQKIVDDSYLGSLVKTTRTGARFLDLSQVPPKEKISALKWASDQKIPALSKEGTDHMAKIETARENIESMLAQAESVLPASPAERIAKYGNRKLSKILQTSDERSAWGTWRVSAIQQLIALAGGLGSGLRVNQAEIMQAVHNDIPTLNDTYGVALRKANNIRKMLDHTEGPLMESDWRKLSGTSLPQAKAPAQNATDPLGVMQ